MVSHTRTILRSPSTDQNNAVLLDIMALAGNIRRDHFAGRQTNTGCLPFTGIRLLRPDDADFDADSLQRRGLNVGQSRRDSMAGSLRFSAALDYARLAGAELDWVIDGCSPVKLGSTSHFATECKRRLGLRTMLVCRQAEMPGAIGAEGGRCGETPSPWWLLLARQAPDLEPQSQSRTALTGAPSLELFEIMRLIR